MKASTATNADLPFFRWQVHFLVKAEKSALTPLDGTAHAAQIADIHDEWSDYALAMTGPDNKQLSMTPDKSESQVFQHLHVVPCNLTAVQCESLPNKEP